MDEVGDSRNHSGVGNGCRGRSVSVFPWGAKVMEERGQADGLTRQSTLPPQLERGMAIHFAEDGGAAVACGLTAYHVNCTSPVASSAPSLSTGRSN
jgi:hypothetical protein